MATLTIQNDDTTAVDCNTYDASASTSYDNNFLKLGHNTGKFSGAYRTLIEFDVSSLPADAFITDATFTLTVNSGQTRMVLVHQSRRTRMRTGPFRSP
jgi:hypothetical protein